MTDQTPTVRASLAFVAAASRPGSIESRHVHGCTCVDDPDRRRVWNPEQVERWQATISLDCPAHGRLLERYLAQVNHQMSRPRTGLAADVAVLGQEIGRVRMKELSAHPQRSLLARLRDAVRGLFGRPRGAQ
jgi:hypothetical protein